MDKLFEEIKNKKYGKKVLEALIWTLFIYPNHARCGFVRILKTGRTFLPLWIGYDLTGQNDLLEKVIALIDNEGRENTARHYASSSSRIYCVFWTTYMYGMAESSSLSRTL